MGFVRKAAILAVAITLIPSDPQDRARLYAKAQDTAAWAATFCERNEATCEQAQELQQAFVEKASFAASAAYDIAVAQIAEGDNEISQRPPRHTWQPAQRTDWRSGGTLTALDREVAWRGHQ